MKRFLPFLILPAVLLQGCVTDTVRAVSTFNNVRSGYQAYQGIEGMKGLSEAKPVLKDSDTLYVVADLKPATDDPNLNPSAAQRICAAFDREFEDIKNHQVNHGRALHCMATGDVPADAVVLNLRELQESNRAMRFVQGDTIKSESAWVSRANGAVLDTQTNPGVKSYDELIDFVAKALPLQMVRSLAPATDDPDYRAWTEHVQAWSKDRQQG